jgi:hypothetical protein
LGNGGLSWANYAGGREWLDFLCSWMASAPTARAEDRGRQQRRSGGLTATSSGHRVASSLGRHVSWAGVGGGFASGCRVSGRAVAGRGGGGRGIWAKWLEVEDDLTSGSHPSVVGEGEKGRKNIKWSFYPSTSHDQLQKWTEWLVGQKRLGGWHRGANELFSSTQV